MPVTQKVGDFSITYKESKLSGVVVNTDAKMQSSQIAVSARNSTIPRSVFIGTIDYSEETSMVKYLARQAIIGNINIANVDAAKNSITDNQLLLKKIEQTGQIEHAKGIIYFPLIFSNRQND